MLGRVYFVVAPSARLARVQNVKHGGIVELLKDSQMWARAAPDRAPYFSEDYQQEMKLLFLANLALETAPLNLLREILGEFDISTDCFDEWWTLSVFEINEFVEEIEAKIADSNLSQIVAKQSVIFSGTLLNAHAIKRALNDEA